jgi:hypothetical protein
MRYAILGLILLMGCTRDLPPLGWDSLWRQGMSGEQWLQYDLEKRRAAALELRETLISRRGNFIKSTAVFLVYELQSLEQEIKEYECIDQPQEACDQEEAALSRRLAGICERLGADDCSADGIFPAGDALVERYLRKTIDAYICAYQIETLDRVARADPESPVLSAALESCGLIMPIVITSTMSALGRKRPFISLVFAVLERPLSGKADIEC